MPHFGVVQAPEIVANRYAGRSTWRMEQSWALFGQHAERLVVRPELFKHRSDGVRAALSGVMGRTAMF